MTVRTVPLGEVAEFVRGITFKPTDVVPPGEAGSVICLRTKNVQTEVDLEDLLAVPTKFVKRSEQYLQQGDVLISSANSWNLVGKCSWIPELPWPSSFGGFVTALRPKSDSVDRRYLYRWFSYGRTQQLLRSFGRKTTNISNLDLEQCREMGFPLPPIEEQRRITAVLDAADELRAKRRQALAKLDTLTQAIFIDMFGDPLSPSSELGEAILSGVASFVRGITFKPDDVLDVPALGSVGVMRTTNVQSDLDTTDVWQIPDSFVKRGDQYLLPYDTLISSANSWNLVGRCCVIPKELPRSTFGGFVTVLRPSGADLTPRYLHAWFSSPNVQTTVRSFGRKTTNISNLDLKQCGKLRIAVPPLSAQVEFEAHLDSVDASLGRHEASLGQLDTLFASLQQRAFQGEL